MRASKTETCQTGGHRSPSVLQCLLRCASMQRNEPTLEQSHFISSWYSLLFMHPTWPSLAGPKQSLWKRRKTKGAPTACKAPSCCPKGKERNQCFGRLFFLSWFSLFSKLRRARGCENDRIIITGAIQFRYFSPVQEAEREEGNVPA